MKANFCSLETANSAYDCLFVEYQRTRMEAHRYMREALALRDGDVALAKAVREEYVDEKIMGEAVGGD